jgi:uncharacterized protein YceH (UPF0502 family)
VRGSGAGPPSASGGGFIVSDASLPDLDPIDTDPIDTSAGTAEAGPDDGDDRSGARPGLTPEQVRVLGCLVEKQLTTPQQYPLTLSALVAACNQTSNRDPVVTFDEQKVELAVRTAKQAGFARFVHPAHGRSALRYQHLLDEVYGLDERQLAVLAVLLLRGPQTIGEIRTRTERMTSFDNLDEVTHEIDLLSRQAGGLVASAPRRPGQKEVRFVHLLGAGNPFDIDDRVGRSGDPDGGSGIGTRSADRLGWGSEQPGASLLDQVEVLRAEVATVRARLDEVRIALGLDGPEG